MTNTNIDKCGLVVSEGMIIGMKEIASYNITGVTVHQCKTKVSYN